MDEKSWNLKQLIIDIPKNGKKNSLKLFFRMSEKIWEDYSIREVTPFPYLFSPVTNCHSLLQEFFTPSSFIFFSLPFWIAHISPLELVLFQPPPNYISPSAVNTLHICNRCVKLDRTFSVPKSALHYDFDKVRCLDRESSLP